MVSEYSKINLSRYCSLRQLTQSELGGALNNGECTVYVNTDGSLCLINKENDLVYINRIFNNINNIKIPEFTPPNNINPKTVYALSSVANTFGQFDLSWVEIPTVSENNSTTGSLPTTPQPTKYLLTSTNGTFTGETDNLQKINITNQSLINNLNTNELDDIMIDGDAVLHKNSSDELCLSRKNNSNVSTISFNRNRIFGIEYPQFLNSIPTGNTANCLRAKTISGSTSLNWLPLESTTNNNTGNVFKTANQFLDNYQINKTKIDLSRQTNINVELNTIELINVLKQRDDYNEFILHARNINFNEKLYLTNKFYNNDLTSDYFTLNTIEMGINQIYDKDIPLFNQNNEDDYILGFIYIGNGSTNTMEDWELSWISVTTQLSYSLQLNNTVTTGDIDNTFNIGGGFDSFVRTIVQQPDGKILAGGGFTTYSGVTRSCIIRLNTGGTVDNTFNIGSGFSGGPVQSIALQPDGKILVGGNFTSYSGVTRNGIIRLNTGGTIDNTFNIGGGFDFSVNTIALQPDGKILVGGDFGTYSGVTSNFIIRLNTGGTIDNTFNIGGGFNFSVYSIVLQPDGKILVGGFFTTYSGVTSSKIIRLNTGGTIDNTFNIGTGFGGSSVDTIALQPDGKILAGGNFSSYSGVTSSRIIRLNTGGTIDNTFNIGSGFSNGLNDTVYSITLQPDGKILAGGNFTSYSGVTSNNIIRLNTGGTIDNNTTFNISGGFSGGTVYSIVLQKNGKILVGGDFTSYNSVTRNKIIRLDMNQNATLNIYKNNVLVVNTSTNGVGNVLLSNNDNFYSEVIIDNFLSSNQLNTIINGNVSPYAEQIPIINLTGTITSSTFIVKHSNIYSIELNTI
jgi:uncharacterized delta-60 repeat protein